MKVVSRILVLSWLYATSNAFFVSKPDLTSSATVKSSTSHSKADVRISNRIPSSTSKRKHKKTPEEKEQEKLHKYKGDWTPHKVE